MNLSVSKESDFSAKEPSLGYLYQIKYGLYLLLSSKHEADTKLLIESLDDIEINNHNAMSLYQTKFHLKKDRNLSDRSSDFWKTIRVWCVQISNKKVNIDETLFTLITTESISTDSILLDIKNNEKTEDIIKKMNEISLEDNEKNIKGYKAYNQLSEKNKKDLIKRIKIIDSSFDFASLDTKIKSELKLSALPNHIQSLYERLEGWFLQQVINHLLGRKDYISFSELNRKILHIIDKFKFDDLPIDFPDRLIDIECTKPDLFESMTFIDQLNLIGASKNIKQNAISDYYRAYNQRSKWINDELLDPQEEIDYEKRLVDDWGRKFDLLLDDTQDKEEIEIKNNALTFYKNYYIMNIPQVFIREKFRESYLALGSSHILSQDLKIGWHPNFKNLKAKISN